MDTALLEEVAADAQDGLGLAVNDEIGRQPLTSEP